MADSATEIPIVLEEKIVETVKNATEKAPVSFEGICIAYTSIVIMASLPIFFGAFRSVKYLKEQKVSLIICLLLYILITVIIRLKRNKELALFTLIVSTLPTV